jgi:MFS family permease
MVTAVDPMEELRRVAAFTKARTVICASICNFMIGAYYFFSNINSYVAAYLRQYNPEISSKDTLLIMPIYIVCQSLGTIISIRLVRKFGEVKVSNYSYTVFALCSLAMVFVKSYWTFVFLYGFVAGLAIGTGYMPALIIAWSYFPDKKSIVTGVCLFTAGISASILSPVSTIIVNPTNVKDYESDPAVYNRVPLLFFCLFLCYGGLNLIGSLLQPSLFVPKTLEELKQLEELDKANKEALRNAPEQEMEIIKGEGKNDVLPISNQESQQREVTADMLDNAIKRGLDRQDGGVSSQAQAFAVAGLSTEQTAAMVINDKAVQLAIEERKESLRRSIRSSMRQGSVRNSVMKMNQAHKFKPMTEEKAVALINQPKPEITEGDKKMVEDLYIPQTKTGCPSLGYALMSRHFALLAFMAYSCSIYNYFMNSVWKAFYVTKIEVTDSQMALILSYGSFANSIVRVLSGIIMMKYDFKVIYMPLVISTVISCFTIDYTLSSYIVGAIYSMTVFGGIGIQVTIFPTVCNRTFGAQLGPNVFPFVFSFFSLANLTQYFMLKFTDNWSLMFNTYGMFAIAGTVVGLIFNSNPSWADAQAEFQEKQLIEEREKATQSDSKFTPLLSK